MLIIPSLQGAVLEDYSLKVAREWKLGRKGVNDGVLLLIAKEDRKLRIEVGRGLEGSLPDALAGRIIQNEIVPRFKAGDFEGGVNAGVSAILAAAAGTYSPPEDVPHWKLLFNDGIWNGIKVAIGYLFFLWLIGTVEVKSILEPDGWVLFPLLAPIWALLAWAPFGGLSGAYAFFAHIIGFPLLKLIIPRTPWGKRLKVTKKAVYYRGSKLYDISSSSGGSSGSSGGSDWGGGGGDFGGGGSSGSW